MRIDIKTLMRQIEISENPVSIPCTKSTAYSVKRRIQKCLDNLATTDVKYCDMFVDMHYDNDTECATFDYVS